MKLSLDIPLRLSKWSFVFEQEKYDDIALYHSLNINVIFLERKFKKIVDLLKIGTTTEFLIQEYGDLGEESIIEIIEEMSSEGLAVRIDNEDMELLKEKRKKYCFPAGVENLYLILTDDCNMGCSYCFIINNMPLGYKCKDMTWEVAKKAIDTYFFNLSKNPSNYHNSLKTIVFYGGEPFLNFKVIKRSVEYVEDRYCKEIEKNFRFSVITNGTVINKEMAMFLSKHKNIAVGISLDGEKYIHDNKRKYRDGRGSFDQTIKGYVLLKQFGCENISISCTIDSHNIDELTSLLKLHEEYNFLSINLNPLLDTEKDKISQEYMEKVSIKMLEYFEVAREKGIYEDRIMRKLQAFIHQKIHSFDCQATGNQIVCSPEGRLGVCQEGIGAKNFFFANVSQDFNFHDNTVIQDWNKRSPLNMPQCFDCQAIGICGGGCTYGAWLRNGSIWSVDDRFCTHSLLTLEWLIWDIYKKI